LHPVSEYNAGAKHWLLIVGDVSAILSELQFTIVTIIITPTYASQAPISPNPDKQPYLVGDTVK